MKYFILALVVFIAISAIIAENDTVTVPVYCSGAKYVLKKVDAAAAEMAYFNCNKQSVNENEYFELAVESEFITVSLLFINDRISLYPVIFNVERPYGGAFGVTPHIGVVMPRCTTTVYCSFRSERIARVPDDGIYIYSIFQKAVTNDKFANAETDKDKERVARKIWSQHRGRCLECLRLPVGFEPRRQATHEPHIELCSGDLPGKLQPGAPKLPREKEELPTSQLPSAEEIHEGNK
uniref:MD-2-related lipid-recognition domain-containing protein n=1 Tax=Setaria digitata TaxID=48799 RepID=A0A915PI18_9BILA